MLYLWEHVNGMAMRNRLREFVDSQGVSVYAFRDKTGIANKTAYDLVNKPSHIPSAAVLQKICDAYQIQPGLILEWVEPKAKSNTEDIKDAD